jgi:cytoskeletal protein CcmA (bactofilin family)
MEEFVIAGKPVLILSKKDIDAEIEQAALDRRPADFAGKTLKSFSLMEKTLDYGINLENALVIGNVFFADSTVNGNINLGGAAVDGSFYFNRGKLIGNLILENAWVGQTVNMAGINITGSILFAKMRVNGFVSLTKAVVLGNVDFRAIEVQNYCQGDLKVKGDILFKNAQINGFLDLSGAIATGSVNLENALVRQRLAAINLRVEETLSLKDSIYNKGLADFSGIPQEKIIQ